MKELKDTDELLSPSLIPIPNTTKVFLDNYTSTELDLEQAFDGMRSQFSKHKQHRVELEDRMNKVTSPAEKKKIKNEITSLDQTLSGTTKKEIISRLIESGITDDISPSNVVASPYLG
jgi:hypothetical protein